MVPPTLIVVTGVPLASSAHLRLDPFTVAVAGLGADGDGEVVTVTVGDGDAGVGVPAEGDGVELLEFVPLGWQEVIPRSSAIVITNPKALSMVSSCILGIPSRKDLPIHMIYVVFCIFISRSLESEKNRRLLK